MGKGPRKGMKSLTFLRFSQHTCGFCRNLANEVEKLSSALPTPGPQMNFDTARVAALRVSSWAGSQGHFHLAVFEWSSLGRRPTE